MASETSIPASQSPLSDPWDGSGVNVLLVDDNDQNLELLEAYLEDLSCELRLARDGMEALDSVAAKHPDVILLDVMMPRMSGFQVCEKLKQDPATKDIPIVMVTALNEVSDVERAIECGADDFLSKPVNKLELLTRVKSLVRISKMQAELQRTLSQLRAFRDQARS
ncbi:MAG: response regulator [Phycisphaerae bacterium]|nr:response regulator [Phycisphaerae bacterium]MBN8596571.1 response regulator [Planctomycetota bacterium]